jgi:hypothetical protein
MDDLSVISIAVYGQKHTFNREEEVNIYVKDSLSGQAIRTVARLSYVNQVYLLVEKKYLETKAEFEGKKATFYLDQKNNGAAKPPSDTHIEYLILEETDLKELNEEVLGWRYDMNRVLKFSEDLKNKLELLRTLLANERAEINLQ